MVTERLKQAFEQAAGALRPEQQDDLANRLLARLAEEKNALAELVQLLEDDDEAAWDATFAENWEKFDRLAEKARAEIATGKATPLDPDKL